MNGARRLRLGLELRRLLPEQRQDLFLIFEDGVQAALIFQDSALIFLYGVLVGFDLFLVGNDHLLIAENLFLIGDDGALGHVVCAPPDVKYVKNTMADAATHRAQTYGAFSLCHLCTSIVFIDYLPAQLPV
jgi:hypothetical protein